MVIFYAFLLFHLYTYLFIFPGLLSYLLTSMIFKSSATGLETKSSVLSTLSRRRDLSLQIKTFPSLCARSF